MKSVLDLLKEKEKDWFLVDEINIKLYQFIAVLPKKEYSSIYRITNINPIKIFHVAQDGKILDYPTSEHSTSYTKFYVVPYDDLPDFLK